MPRTPHSTPPINTVAYPTPLARAEAEQVAVRRRAAGVTGAPATNGVLPDDTLGVGLSGGGVRSATFCLGVFQALARAHALKQVDFLSTVSGGGYFGSFLGRLFSRPWITGVADVEHVLLGEEPRTPQTPGATAWAGKVFDWLRENGRYLAPRGSGDLLLLGALLLRNWVAVQTVFIVTMLTGFGALQLVRIALERWLVSQRELFDATAWLVCSMPLGNSLLWWSPLLLTPLVPFALMAAPAGWAYWLVSRDADGQEGVPAFVGALVTCAVAGSGVWHYAGTEHHARLVVCGSIAGFAGLSLIFWAVGETWVRWIRPEPGGSVADSGNRLRTGLTRCMKTGLVVAGVLLVAALVDTLGGTIYALSEDGQLARWGVALASAFATVGAFARSLSMIFARRSRSDRPGLSFSSVSWIAAVGVLAIWLVSVDVGAQALRWGFAAVPALPAGFASAPTPQVLGADALVIAGSDQERTVTARRNAAVACRTQPPAMPTLPPFLLASTAVLAVFTLLFGQTRRFANLSSVHGFYTARLTRTFLGASNDARLSQASSAVSETTRGDDCAGDAYWHWPTPTAAATAPGTAPMQPWMRGGPLHLVNTTVNETVDARSHIQNQDRKGIGLAVGPSGLSLGIRHHLVAGDTWQVFPADPHAHRVFKVDSTVPPEPLSLGRWMSVSGAAFSAAAGANTTVPLAILCGMFNVRLGYWWNSGTGYHGRWIERLLPVQSAFFAEMFARTHGTAGQLWNLSDGGHFENMGGYELIRRRLPIIVIVDAEADPDYTFEGLSDLVRKARLDFKAEIVFLNAFDLNGPAPSAGAPAPTPPIPASVRPYFGDLDALRRGKWTEEKLTSVTGENDHRFTLEVDRTRPSKAHAALARVTYGEPGDPNPSRSWLVYVKATLMGDEPEDVCHYHRGHPDFPQETTLDQFFDEAQWESYRRLGQHVGHRVLTPELLAHLAAHPA